MTLEWWQPGCVRPALEEALRSVNETDCRFRLGALGLLSKSFRESCGEDLQGGSAIASLLTEGIPVSRRRAVCDTIAHRSPETASKPRETDWREPAASLSTYRENPSDGAARRALHELGRFFSGPDARGNPPAVPAGVLDVLFDAILAEPSGKLAVYGTLAPGEANHEVLAGVDGVWQEGFVRGVLHESGWGAPLGFPGLRWNPSGGRVTVKMLVSTDLRGQWGRLDEFEGDEYRRILVPVEDGKNTIAVANIYVIDDHDGV